MFLITSLIIILSIDFLLQLLVYSLQNLLFVQFACGCPGFIHGLNHQRTQLFASGSGFGSQLVEILLIRLWKTVNDQLIQQICLRFVESLVKLVGVVRGNCKLFEYVSFKCQLA